MGRGSGHVSRVPLHGAERWNSAGHLVPAVPSWKSDPSSVLRKARALLVRVGCALSRLRSRGRGSRLAWKRVRATNSSTGEGKHRAAQHGVVVGI